MDKQNFLKIIKMIESSGGQNTNHPKITQGIHAGDQAVGNYALMPNTAKELLNRRRLAGLASEDEANLKDLDNATLRDRLEANPNLQEGLVGDMADLVLNKAKGDPEKAAFLYNMGHNRKPEDITPEMLQKTDYVQKFNKLRSKLNTGM